MLMCPCISCVLLKFILAASRVEQDASKEGELLPLHLTDSPGVRRTKTGSTVDSGTHNSHGNGTRGEFSRRQQKPWTRLHAGEESVSQDLGLGAVGRGRTSTARVPFDSHNLLKLG